MPPVPSPQTVLDRVRRDVELAASGPCGQLVPASTGPGVGLTPKDVVYSGARAAGHYRNEPDGTAGCATDQPLLIVFSLISRSYILDLTLATASSSNCSMPGSTCTCSTGASRTSATRAASSRTTSTTTSPPASSGSSSSPAPTR